MTAHLKNSIQSANSLILEILVGLHSFGSFLSDLVKLSMWHKQERQVVNNYISENSLLIFCIIEILNFLITSMTQCNDKIIYAFYSLHLKFM